MISFIHGASVVFAQHFQPMTKLKAERIEEEKGFFQTVFLFFPLIL
jgi:hypothetical protein